MTNCLFRAANNRLHRRRGVGLTATTSERCQLTRLVVSPGDAGFVVREGGELDLFIPQTEGDESVPPDHVVLAGFAMAFNDERLRDLLAQIVGEKQH